MKRTIERAVAALLTAASLQATSHCYKQRSNCFVVEDGESKVQMYTKRDRFTKAAHKHGLSKKEIERMIKKGEGRREKERTRQDLRDERGYYGGVYWPHPIYAYPPHYWDDHPHHPHPTPEPGKPEKPTHGPITIQPTENPAFNRPGRPGHGPSTQPATRPQRPAARPRPRPIRRAR